MEAVPVEIEVDVSPASLPKTTLVDLPEKAAKESTQRVARTIVNSGYLRPQDRVVINMARVEVPKKAASFDLPIALGTHDTPMTFTVVLFVLGEFCMFTCCVFVGFAVKFALDAQLLATMFLLLKSIFCLILLRFEFLATRRLDCEQSRKLAWLWSNLATQFTVLLSVWYFMGRADYVIGQ